MVLTSDSLLLAACKLEATVIRISKSAVTQIVGLRHIGAGGFPLADG